MITPDNWTHTHYANQDLRAIVSFGANPTDTGICEEYYATVIGESGKDVFQKEFNNLNEACDYLNARYAPIWDFMDATAPSSKEGGCATCVAH